MSLWSHFVEFIDKIQFHNFSLKVKKTQIVRCLTKSKSWQTHKIILSNSSDVMVTPFIIKEGSGTICHLGFAILNSLSVFHFTIEEKLICAYKKKLEMWRTTRCHSNAVKYAWTLVYQFSNFFEKNSKRDASGTPESPSPLCTGQKIDNRVRDGKCCNLTFPTLI